MILTIAAKSLISRKVSVGLTLLSLLVSVSLLLSVEHIRVQAKESFNRTVSGVDLIVGARTGQTNLLLYSVFRIGSPSNNISWNSFESLSRAGNVAWTIPISLGDSHRGYPVVGTNNSYFEHFQYGDKQALEFEDGEAFSSPLQTVVGAEIAERFNYQVGDALVMSHGIGHTSFHHHEDSPFIVSGVLAPTGTPVDQTVHVSLTGVEVMHMSENEQKAIQAQLARGEAFEIAPESVTAILVGLESKFQTLTALRQINQFTGEPLTAILPGLALAELWKIVGNVENLLRVIAILILISSLLGMSTMLLTAIRERLPELAVLRAIGAKPYVVFVLIQTEALMISLLACLLSLGFVWVFLTAGGQWLNQTYGIFVDANIFTSTTFWLIAIVCSASLVISCIPAISAYQKALQQGLQAK